MKKQKTFVCVGEITSASHSLENYLKCYPLEHRQQHGRAELLAGFKFDDASSVMASGRLHMTRNRTDLADLHVSKWRFCLLVFIKQLFFLNTGLTMATYPLNKDVL